MGSVLFPPLQALDSYVIIWRLLEGSRLNGVGDEAEDGTDPEQHREAVEEVLAELDPLGDLLGRRERVRAVPVQVLLGTRLGQTLHATQTENGVTTRSGRDTGAETGDQQPRCGIYSLLPPDRVPTIKEKRETFKLKQVL